jgi:carbon storage regulator
MLVLTRKENEKIQIGDNITITVVRTSGDKVRLGIEAPADMKVLRTELVERTPSPPAEELPRVGSLQFSPDIRRFSELQVS